VHPGRRWRRYARPLGIGAIEEVFRKRERPLNLHGISQFQRSLGAVYGATPMRSFSKKDSSPLDREPCTAIRLGSADVKSSGKADMPKPAPISHFIEFLLRA